MKITTLISYFGSNRMLAHEVGKLLDGCSWVGVGFAGGMSELRHIKARTVVVNDLHRHVMNLAMVVSWPTKCDALIRALESLPFHPDVLAEAQTMCAGYEARGARVGIPDVEWAKNYFVASWMARSGKAGTDEEFTAGLSVRWEAGGGDSATRYRNAVESLREWQKVLERCTFVCMNVFDFLTKVKDRAGHGLYLDPPFPDAGDEYRHKFTEQDHRWLAKWLSEGQVCRIVCRFHDHPMIRELYPETLWTWHRFTGRAQTNEARPEVLITRNL